MGRFPLSPEGARDGVGPAMEYGAVNGVLFNVLGVSDWFGICHSVSMGTDGCELRGCGSPR